MPPLLALNQCSPSKAGLEEPLVPQMVLVLNVGGNHGLEGPVDLLSQIGLWVIGRGKFLNHTPLLTGGMEQIGVYWQVFHYSSSYLVGGQPTLALPGMDVGENVALSFAVTDREVKTLQLYGPPGQPRRWLRVDLGGERSMVCDYLEVPSLQGDLPVPTTKVEGTENGCTMKGLQDLLHLWHQVPIEVLRNTYICALIKEEAETLATHICDHLFQKGIRMVVRKRLGLASWKVQQRVKIQECGMLKDFSQSGSDEERPWELCDACKFEVQAKIEERRRRMKDMLFTIKLQAVRDHIEEHKGLESGLPNPKG
ncbi:hypothetical protein AOLI_G00250030 [Acnodon oligacanthus]